MTGSVIHNHLENIRLISKNKLMLKEHQNRNLQLLLEHAVQTAEYYKGYKNCGTLNKFPIVNKNIIRESYNKFESTVYRGKNLRIAVTSGSTGTPFRLVQNRNKRKRLLADVIYSNSVIGYQIGSRHIWTIAGDSPLRESRIGLFIKNRIEFSHNLINSDTVEDYIKVLVKDKKIEIIMGYSSVLFELSKFILEQKLPYSFSNIKGILCLSEPLYPQMRKIIQAAFNCPVLSRYSNEECGVLAYECPQCMQFHLNAASFIFEILEMETDKPAAAGSPGRIIVTDLYNYALPLIRYDTGDVGSIGGNYCNNFATPALKTLEGRKLDCIYDTENRKLAPFVLDEALNLSDVFIKQFQFVQEDKINYKLRLCVNDKFAHEQVIIEKLKNILGEKARISVEYVEEIPVLNSGKRKYVINCLKPDNRDMAIN